jgi:hypothetical protein
MSELDPLPQRPRVPVFAPRTGDYAAVVGRAQHRRRRHLAGAGAGVAGVAVLVALTTGGAGGSFGLDPVQPATGVVAPEESAAPGESPTLAPTGSPSAEPSATPGETGAPGESTGPREEPRPSESEVRIDPDDPDHTVPPRVTEKPYVLREDVEMVASRCEPDGAAPAATGWCFYYDGPASVRAGDAHPYRINVCRLPGRGARTLRYDGEQQVDFVVGNNTRDEWRWSGGYDFGTDPTEVTVNESRCSRWTVTWDGTDAYGEHVRPGEYTMSPELKVSDWGDAINNGTSYGFGYALEVTE